MNDLLYWTNVLVFLCKTILRYADRLVSENKIWGCSDILDGQLVRLCNELSTNVRGETHLNPSNRTFHR